MPITEPITAGLLEDDPFSGVELFVGRLLAVGVVTRQELSPPPPEYIRSGEAAYAPVESDKANMYVAPPLKTFWTLMLLFGKV